LAEQHAGRSIADVLTLHTSSEPTEPSWVPPDTGGLAVAEAPPKVRRRQTVEPSALARRRSHDHSAPGTQHSARKFSRGVGRYIA
jgi:hypothetical protein